MTGQGPSHRSGFAVLKSVKYLVSFAWIERVSSIKLITRKGIKTSHCTPVKDFDLAFGYAMRGHAL